MDRDKVLVFSDHVGRFYAERYGFPPVAGRLIGYLYVCQPAQQSINDIADALLASRSAINNGVKMLGARPNGSVLVFIRAPFDSRGIISSRKIVRANETERE